MIGTRNLNARLLGTAALAAMLCAAGPAWAQDMAADASVSQSDLQSALRRCEATR